MRGIYLSICFLSMGVGCFLIPLILIKILGIILISTGILAVIVGIREIKQDREKKK
jgi:hypothetical protein